MSRIPESNDNGREHRDGDVVKVVGAVVFLVYAMYYTWNFVGPSGQTMSIGSFIAFFFREMSLVGFFGLALIIGCFVWLFGRVRNLFHRGRDAP